VGKGVKVGRVNEWKRRRVEKHGGPGDVEVLPRSLRYASAESAVAPVGMTP
jgi:hypothetical protein